MPVIWCAVSGHGFGHAAQLVPVLNALGKRASDLHVILRTNVPEAFFQEILHIPWTYVPAQQDIGCIQDGPLSIDVQKTWKAYEAFHADWDNRLTGEIDDMIRVNPALVISNISYLAIAAAVKAGYPSVALASLSWDQILSEYLTPGVAKQEQILEQIRLAYQGTRTVIRPFPGISMPAFPNLQDVGPIIANPVSPQKSLRDHLHMTSEERLVLVAFGGIPMLSLPLAELEGMEGYRFLISGELNCRDSHRVVATNQMGRSFRQILAEADIVMTKPGYATIVEAVRLGLPMVYVRRYNFADEQPLVEYVHRYGQAVELSVSAFEAGQWEEALEEVQALPRPNAPMPKEGTDAAVDVLMKMLG